MDPSSATAALGPARRATYVPLDPAVEAAGVGGGAFIVESRVTQGLRQSHMRGRALLYLKVGAGQHGEPAAHTRSAQAPA